MSADFARLGAEIRARRESLGLSLRELARRADLSPSTLSLVERGGPVIGEAALERIADAVLASAAMRDCWLSLSGRMPDDIAQSVVAAPERWNDLRAWLMVQRARGMFHG